MIANLPLLFANGNPTALTKITAAELEKFISFMVTCSWGHDTAKDIEDIRRPPWWPRDVEFSHPFTRPNPAPNDWETRLKSLVKKCYDYHKSPFLLVFSAQLARYPRNRLRYVDNHDHTTSLYYRPNGRLLVTFRNENVLYDKEVEIVDLDKEPEVKSADIYLCDNCDSHFDNLDILKAHERLCNNETVPQSTCSGGLPEFLSALKLLPLGEKPSQSVSGNNENETRPRNARNSANIDRGPPYPFSSLAYIRNAKINVQRDTNYSRERIERYCCTTAPISKTLASKSKNQQFPIRYRRPVEYWQRKHRFPSQRKKDILDLKAQLYLLKCRPVTVDVGRMSEASMTAYMEQLKLDAAARREAEKDVVVVDGAGAEGERAAAAAAAAEVRDPLRRADDCEVIDLCSDDEGPSANENCDPRAGVACVMRGGAVLRRTGAAPGPPPGRAAEPCGAAGAAGAGAGAGRAGAAGATAVLHPALLHPRPHPVILIAHSTPLTGRDLGCSGLVWKLVNKMADGDGRRRRRMPAVDS